MTKTEYISALQRQVLLHSIIYYHLDYNILSDKDYDEISKTLVKEQSENDIKDTDYYYVFYDFDGSTGFDLYDRLNIGDKNHLYKIAQHMIWLDKRSNKKKGEDNG